MLKIRLFDSSVELQLVEFEQVSISVDAVAQVRVARNMSCVKDSEEEIVAA